MLTQQIDRRMQRWLRQAYQKNWRQRNGRKLVAFGLTLLRDPRAVTRPDAPSFYTPKTPYATDLATPLWSNLGYWAEARTVVEAQIELARYVARAGRFTAADEMLDVGCGSGDQDILWCRESSVRHIAGIDITPVRVELANRRAAAAGLSDRISIQVGSATRLPFADASFDVVTALESAMHFDTREAFMHEAFRVLRPGGRIVWADLAVGPDGPVGLVTAVLQRLGRRMISIPEANVDSAAAYEQKLAGCGFAGIAITSIGDYVFPGCVRYRAMLANGGRSSDPVSLEADDFHAEQWNSQWRDGLGLGEYVVVTAHKPAAAA